MAMEMKVEFDLTQTDYDHGFGSTITHRIEARPTPVMIAAVTPVRIEGSLSVQGIDLKPGQRITAVFTITD